MKIMSRLFLALGLVILSSHLYATDVQIETNMGTIDIELFDSEAPVTVENFLTYVEQEKYLNTVFHRLVKGFVLQGGGFAIDVIADTETGIPSYEGVPIETNGTIRNEAKWSNDRATVAMAKIGGDPDSATSQWFVNLADNGENLNVQNSGFTVFGRVTDSTMPIIDAISELTIYPYVAGVDETCEDIGIGDAPLMDYTEESCESGVYPAPENFVKILNITITNPSSDANPLDYGIERIPEEKDEGGAFMWLMLIVAPLLRNLRVK